MSRGAPTNSANMAPLGATRRPLAGNPLISGGSGNVGVVSLLNPNYMGGADAAPKPNVPVKRTADTREGRSDEKSSESREERRKKRKSRWETESAKTCIPGLPTMIPAGLTKDQEQAYLLQLKN